ncbi:MAG: ABC transporter permease subunit [Thermoanaerobaculum sp.]
MSVVSARIRARRREQRAKVLISAAAFLVLGFTFLLFAYLVVEVLPLVRPARLAPLSEVSSREAVLAFPGELPGSLWVVSTKGVVRLEPQGEEVVLPGMVPPVAQVAADRWGRWLGVVDAEGLKVFPLRFRASFVGQDRRLALKVGTALGAPGARVKVLALGGEGEPVVVGVNSGGTWIFRASGGELSGALLTPVASQAAAVDDKGSAVWLAAGRDVQLWDGAAGALLAVAPLPAPVTTLSLLLGDTTCLVGDEAGKVRAVGAYREGESMLLESFAVFSGKGPVLALAPSPRSKAFAILHPKELEVAYLTSRRVLARQPVVMEGRADLAFSPRGDRLQVADRSGKVAIFSVDLGHPEATLTTLFAKVRYEGYRKASWTWQSTGGSNAFEPKLSLVPLIVGSLKGAFYAMLFSGPLAFLAALYTSQFAPSGLRRWVKPAVELLAGVPSVVVGLVAALVLAPWVARHLWTLLVAFFLVPGALLAAGWLCELRPRAWQLALQRRWERLLTFGILVVTAGGVAVLAPASEQLLFPGGFLEFLHGRLGVSYDQRNALVTGFALGFAVLPMIFTLAEEALSNVPESLANAALSLGASRARAAWTVVVPAAAPGLAAALLLGFGRAVGETMIVLMASGNAPVLSFSPFSGMRTMAACIAVELPEAAYGETLYRVLLLVALLLFAFTLFTNILGRFVERHLRRRFEGAS